MDVRCFPLSYNLQSGLEPNPTQFCDSPVCRNNSSQQIEVLACFHTFHTTCLSADGSCVICDAPLKRLAKQLSDTFNKGLMSDKEENSDVVSSSDDDHSGELELTSAEEAEKYYTSPAWQRKIINIISTYDNIQHPTKANHQQTQQNTAQRNSSASHRTHVNPLNACQLTVLPIQTADNITIWHFPSMYSQSTLNGRSGSNACTFIALVLSKLFFASPEMPRPNQPLSSTWVFRMVQGMDIGNKFYDSHSAGNPARMFGVIEAAQKIQGSIGIQSVGPELPADITRQPVATANLAYHVELASTTRCTSSLFILNDKTVAFVSLGQSILLMDSHCHGHSGAYIAMAHKSNLWDLLKWHKNFNRFQYSMGTVTNVTFH